MKYHRKNQQGQAILEFALVMPILILLLLAVVYFAMAFNLQIVLNNAVREGARAWANSPGNTSPCCSSCVSPCDPDADTGFKRNVMPIIRKYVQDNGYDPDQVVTTLAYIYKEEKDPQEWNEIIDSAEDATKVKLTLLYSFQVPGGDFSLTTIQLRTSYTFKRGS